MRPPRLLLLATVAVALTLFPGLAMASVQPVDPRPPAGASVLTDWPCWPYEPCPTLTVSVAGNGSGRVFTKTGLAGAADGLIDCRRVNGVTTANSICTRQFHFPTYSEHIEVYYSQVAEPGSQSCNNTTGCGHDITGYLLLAADGNPQILGGFQFQLLSYPVTVTKSGSGSGTVTSYPVGIDFGAPFLFGSTVTLTATADAGAYFAGWTGRCAGQGAVCPLKVEVSNTTNAVFQFGSPPPTPGPTATAHPQGTPKTTHGATAPPGSTPPATDPAAATNDPTAPAPTSDGASGPSAGLSPGPTDPPIVPVGNVTTDLTPIALAILAAGLIIAFAVVGVAFYVVRRRTAPPPP